MKTKLSLYEYFKKYGIIRLIKYHTFIDGKRIELTDKMKDELKQWNFTIKCLHSSFDNMDCLIMHKRLRLIIGCRLYNELTYDLK